MLRSQCPYEFIYLVHQKCGTNHNEEHYLVGIAGIRDEHKLETQNYQPIEIQVKPPDVFDGVPYHTDDAPIEDLAVN